MSSTTQQFNCIFCKETFENKEDLQIHFRKHGDPKFNQKPKNRPTSEQTVEKKNEAPEMVRCDVCPEMFPTISKAITHKHKVHPDHDAKYFCPWCGKLFTMKHLYNKHLQSSHENSVRIGDIKFYCDVCEVDFYVPSAMLYHNKFFHRQDTDLPTIGQSKKLRMFQQEALQISYCAFCGDEYDNKVNLHKHMGDDHSDENQSPEDILRCPLCEAIFYHLDAFEVHLTFHTTEDLYSEKNEMFEKITEFSLETVPPIVEKVENFDHPEDVESAMNAVGIDKFLEMAMDLGSDGTKSKPKKHKKHKKKKKEAITLDEFLNMNQDVFGEGLDFQGIEEVPSQVVARRLKQKKTVKPLGNLKVAQSSELEKLKKQGIVVKRKTTKKTPAQNLKVGSKIVTKSVQSVNKPNVQSPDEVLSKLMNQSNSQIKIVKRSTQDSQDEGNVAPIGEDVTLDKKTASPENIQVDCDVNMPSENASSENETKEENINKISKAKADENDQQSIQNSSKDISNLEDHRAQEILNSKREPDETYNDEEISVSEHIQDDNKKDYQGSNEGKGLNDLGSIIALKNNTGITIKSSIQNVAQPVVEEPDDDEPDTKEDKSVSNLVNEHGGINEDPDNSANNSLNALKHLSHLITVKSVTPKRSSTPVPLLQSGNEEKKLKIAQTLNKFCQNKDEKPESPEETVIQAKETSINSLNSLKNISKNITIKPVIQSPKKNIDKSNSGDEEEDELDSTPRNKSEDQTMSNTQISSKLVKNLDKKIPSRKGQNITKATKSSTVKEIPNVQEKPSNAGLLKHLTNVTAKPVNTAKSNIQQVTNNASVSTMQSKQNLPLSLVKNQETNENIEIFNIDDSDDETDNKIEPTTNKPDSPKPNTSENKSTKSFSTLKNISKQITVKPVNQQAAHITRSIVKQNTPEHMTRSGNQCSFSDFSDEDDDLETLVPTNLKMVQQKLKLQNDNLKTLKNLGKHITVKSGNPSPNSSVKSGKDHNSRDFDMNDGAESDDSLSGKVKITEITDEHAISDNDMAEQSNTRNSELGNVTVKSEQNSDHENFDEAKHDDFDDLEHQIKANTLKKPDLNVKKVTYSRNYNKKVKPMADNKGPKEMDSVTKNIIPNINSELSIKPFKQIKAENSNGEDAFINKKVIMNAAQVKRSIINQNQSMNQTVASSTQQNTVNKEVKTVKTFQTKTVIQEITTTVTKTIKTVNQTVKQEVQNTSQNKSVKYQKVQGMKACNQQIKNFQGVTVRHAPPLAGTKIRGGAPSTAGNIKPSPVPCNQLVPVRPPRNTARMSVPRMPAVKKAGPTSQPRPNVGRPLKISPNAVNSMKRPIEEPVGHFSCFKKPKESLIPVSEIPSFGEEISESTVQFSQSQMSKSNFTTAKTVVKGNTVVTQMKSEVSASSQHLEKLNSMSGLKVVKTSQSKAMKVEEKCEMSPSKRNALEAIEKLQKQGLLVKKPRLDVNNDSDSNEGHDYITEEPDD